MKRITPWLASFAAQPSLVIYSHAVYLLILVLSCAASLALGQDRNWDLLNYHFYNPYMFLTGRLGFDYFPAQTTTFLNPLMDIPTYLMITHFKPWVVGAIMGVWHGLNLILVYQITWRVFHFLSPLMVATLATGITILSALGSIVWGLWGTFMGDLTVSIFVLAALKLLFLAIDPVSGKTRIRQIIWSGVFIGLGTGLKATSAIHVIPLLMLSFWFGSTLVGRLRTFMIFATASLAGFLITYGYWALILQSRFGSPFFPYYNGIFRSPFVAPMNLTDFLHWMPESILGNLLLPFTFFLNGGGLGQAEIPFRDWRPAIAFTALLLLAISLVWRGIQHKSLSILTSVNTKPMLILSLFFFGSWTIWQIQFAYFRYTASLQFIIPLVVLAATFLIIPKSQVLVGVLSALFILLMPTTEPLDYGRAAWTDDYFQVNLPPMLDLENSQVLIADLDRPLAYFIPFFPASAQVLRITSNLDGLLYGDEQPLLINQLDQELHQPLKKFVMYVNNPSEVDIQVRINRALAYYDLQIQPLPCHEITSNFLVATLCRIQKVV